MKGTVTSKGELHMPAKILRSAHISPGTRVRFEIIKGGIAIYPEYADDIDKACGIAARLGLPPDIERDEERELG
jgi:hypothetical protein